MKPTRLLSVALASLLIAISLTACAENTNHLETQENTNFSVTETNETEISDDLPDGLYYDGDEIVFIILRNHSAHKAGTGSSVCRYDGHYRKYCLHGFQRLL